MKMRRHPFRLVVLVVSGLCSLICFTGCGGHQYWEDVTDYHFDVSPSGERIAFTARGKGGRDLYLLYVPTRSVRPLTNSDQFEGEGRFLSEDTLVVSAVAHPKRPWSAVHLYQLDVPSGKTRPVTTDPDAMDVSLVPVGGSEVLYDRVRLQRGVARVLDVGGRAVEGTYLLHLQTGAEQVVLDPFSRSYYDFRAVFQNRRQLLLDNEYDDVHGIKIATLNKPVGTGQARIVREELLVGKGYRATLSPDERFVYYVVKEEGTFSIVRVDLKTRKQTVMTARDRYILDLRARGRWLFWLEGGRPDITAYGSSMDVTLWRMDTQSKQLEMLLSPAQFANPLRKP